MRLLAAIPGSPAPTPERVPADAPALAVAAVERLSAAMAAKVLFGFLDPPFPRALVDQLHGELMLHVVAASAVTRRGTSDISIAWRWRQLWQTEEWYEMGWHPDDSFHALDEPVAAALWDALNPGKRPNVRARRP